MLLALLCDNFDNFCQFNHIFDHRGFTAWEIICSTKSNIPNTSSAPLAGANRIHNAQATVRLKLLHRPFILKGIICTNSLKRRAFLGFKFSPISIGWISHFAVSTRISCQVSIMFSQINILSAHQEAKLIVQPEHCVNQGEKDSDWLFYDFL